MSVRYHIPMLYLPLGQNSIRFLVSPRVASDPRVGIFYFNYLFAMKRCSIAAKIARLIGILPCCVLIKRLFFT